MFTDSNGIKIHKPDYVCRYIHSDDGDLVKYKLLRSNLDEERWVSIKDTEK
ncbi:hypothetical protein HanXRQr2_Chr08g0346631 [Helianthus annuus]|uniref:Uncharacterized protein n=1 Tax=Helianthus annuus TaxID=4232 RepID=A0A9K3ND45_HELAN|nr:hypothetical protein HanXRQr2_Chr08g0346631 [Helianthus annuus]